MSFLDTFVLFVLIIIMFMYLKKQFSEVEYVQSTVDNEKYLVLKLADKLEAANTLARLIRDMKKLIKYLKEKYPDNKSVQRLAQNFDAKEISEGSPTSGYTSYTINKGKMVLCIRQKDKGMTLIKDMNLLRYVTIHECSHLGSKEIGHTAPFWKTFKFFLNEAVDMGLYVKTDYALNPKPYCGIRVSSSII